MPLQPSYTCKEEDQVGTSSAESHVNYRYLPTSEKDERLNCTASIRIYTTKRFEQVQHKLALAIEDKGILIDESMNGDLMN